MFKIRFRAFFKKPDVNWEDFNPEENYTPSQLDAFATSLLRKDRKEHKEEHGVEPPVSILFEEQLYNRSKREISVNALEIDETLTNSMADGEKPGVTKGDGQKLYHRSHPKGRRVNTEEARKRGSSYYANLIVNSTPRYHMYYDDPWITTPTELNMWYE